ncbi:MAG: sulfotransferase domain-containing protein, partial [Alphaproteobacteria bacterium]
NPLDVTLSYADHYGISHAQTVEAMASGSLTIQGRADRAPEFLGDWSSHVRGWTTAEGLARLVLRYEDIAADPAGALRRGMEFLRQPVDEARLASAVAHSRFEALANQEALGGFRERSRNQAKFFRSGKAGQWRTDLAPDLVAKVVAAHGDVMREHGYLDAAGEPI